MSDLWKWGGAIIGSLVLGAAGGYLSRDRAISQITATRRKKRKKLSENEDFNLLWECCGDEDPKEVTAAVELRPVKGGRRWKADRFSARLVPKPAKRGTKK